MIAIPATFTPPGETTYTWHFDRWQVQPSVHGFPDVIVGVDYRVVAACADPEVTAEYIGFWSPASVKPGQPDFKPLNEITHDDLRIMIFHASDGRAIYRHLNQRLWAETMPELTAPIPPPAAP